MGNKTSFKVLAVIPARGGSKGLPRKNILEIDGEPLIARTIRHAIEANCIDRIVVSTDDAQIAELARIAGATVPFVRPAELSTDLATTEATLKHALEQSEILDGVKYDIGVFLAPTEIFRRPGWISQAVEMLRVDPLLDSVFVGLATHKNFWEKSPEGRWERLRPWMSEYSSRQVRRFVIREDTGIVSASRAAIWRLGRRIGDNVEIIINDDDFSSIDIHSQSDLDLANCAIKIKPEYQKND